MTYEELMKLSPIERILAVKNAKPIPVPIDKKEYLKWLKSKDEASSQSMSIRCGDTGVTFPRVAKIGDAITVYNTKTNETHTRIYNRSEGLVAKMLGNYLAWWPVKERD